MLDYLIKLQSVRVYIGLENQHLVIQKFLVNSNNVNSIGIGIQKYLEIFNFCVTFAFLQEGCTVDSSLRMTCGIG